MNCVSIENFVQLLYLIGFILDFMWLLCLSIVFYYMEINYQLNIMIKWCIWKCFKNKWRRNKRKEEKINNSLTEWYCLILMQFYTFLETTLVTLSLLRYFVGFFTDGEIIGAPGTLAATFITFSKFFNSIIFV